jgi:hypothetical protein
MVLLHSLMRWLVLLAALASLVIVIVAIPSDAWRLG